MSKYKAIKTEIDGIKFDSILESKYYSHLLFKVASGQIDSFELQPVFVLQGGIKHEGKPNLLPIKYKADFKVIHNDSSVEIIDVKGFENALFKLKKKMFDYHYPGIKLTLLTYVEKHGGWITLDELERIRKANRKVK